MADGDAGAAIRAAKAVARRWGVRDYRDLVAGAWLGVRAAAARGVVAGPMVAAAGRRGVIDLLRVEAPDGLKRTARGRGDRPPEQLGLTADAHAAPPATPDPQARLLECWGEHRGRRVWLPMRHRVAGYLRYVEGLSQEEITVILRLESATGGRGLLQRCRRKLERELREELARIGHRSTFFDDV